METANNNIGRITTPEQHTRIAYKNLRGIVETLGLKLPEQARSKIIEASFHLETALTLSQQAGTNEKRSWGGI